MTTTKQLRIIEAQSAAEYDNVYAPRIFVEATLDDDDLENICNGCGSPNSAVPVSKCPQTFLGVPMYIACMIHDYMYYIGVTPEDKDRADRVFRNNMLRLTRLHKKRFVPDFVYRVWIQSSYRAVKHFGGPAFWNGKPDPKDEV